MMKKLYTYLLAAVTLFGVASCSDSVNDDINPDTSGKEVNVTLRISAASNHAETRAASADANGITRASWKDGYATDDEMMKSWVIVVADGYSIKYILQDSYSSGEKEEDEVTVKLTKGTEYTLYSFANITLSDLGLSDNSTSLPEDFANKTFAVSGNKDKVSDFQGGIPMSGAPVEWTPSSSNDSKDLEVVRMVAKVAVQFSNATSSEMKVSKVALTDITSDGNDNAHNLNLLPKIDDKNTVLTSLTSSAKKALREVSIPDDKQTISANSAATGWDTSKDSVVFYVNESEAGVPHYFQLTVTMGDGSTKKYAFLDWKSIARNEYIRIPVVLNDYYIDWQVQGFTAIGVLPSITKSQDLLVIKSPSYGEFHIIPTMYKNSISSDNALTYGTSEGNWSVNTTNNNDGTPYGWQSIEMNPSGGVGTNIFDVEPTWNGTTQKIDGLIGNRTGYAIYQLAVTIGSTTIPYKVEIVKE